MGSNSFKIHHARIQFIEMFYFLDKKNCYLYRGTKLLFNFESASVRYGDEFWFEEWFLMNCRINFLNELECFI